MHPSSHLYSAVSAVGAHVAGRHSIEETVIVQGHSVVLVRGIVSGVTVPLTGRITGQGGVKEERGRAWKHANRVNARMRSPHT